MKLKYQLFITLLVASALLIALMFVISSWTFSRGFVSYINRSHIEHLQPVIKSLAEDYEENGHWNWISKDSPEWHQLRTLFTQRNGRAIAPPGSRTREVRQSPDGAPRSRKPPTLYLADADRNLLIGKKRPGKTIRWEPITVQQTTVGYVGYNRLSRPERQFDQLFEQQQKRSLGLAALAMVALSALLSIPLAARIVKPLLAVNHAVGEISKGEFSHRLNLERRDEFGDLASNINHLGHTLEENRNSRQRWIAEISHELRTPVAVLRSELEAIQDGVRQPNQEAVDSLHAEVVRLNRLINDLHMLSMSDVGALNYSMTNLRSADLLQSFLDSQQQQLLDAGLELDFHHHTNAEIVGDQHRLEQLLSNLMQNTIRYSDPAGKLVVALHERDQKIIINWSDSGPGVSDDALKNLFQPLFRADQSRNREFGGSGLGLAITMKIIEAHAGTVSADHSPLGGLSIIIELPVRQGGSERTEPDRGA